MVIFDVAIGDYRDATQSDLDELIRVKNEYAQVRVSLFKIMADMENLLQLLQDTQPD